MVKQVSTNIFARLRIDRAFAGQFLTPAVCIREMWDIVRV